MDAMDKARILRINAETLDKDTNVTVTRKPEIMFDSEYEQTLIATVEQIVGKVSLLCAHGDVKGAKQIAKTIGEETGAVIEASMLDALINWES